MFLRGKGSEKCFQGGSTGEKFFMVHHFVRITKPPYSHNSSIQRLQTVGTMLSTSASVHWQLRRMR